MMVPYWLRLLCLCLAAFFVIHSVVGVVVAAGGGAAVRAARLTKEQALAQYQSIIADALLATRRCV